MSAAPIGPYSPVLRAGDWVITSGQLALKDGKLVPGGVEAETKQVVANVAERPATASTTVVDERGHSGL